MSDLDFSAQGTPDDESGVPDFSGGGVLVADEPEVPDFSAQGIPDDVQTSSPARGVPVNAPTIGGVPLPDSMLPMTPAAAAEASRAAPVQATPEQKQASQQEIAAKTSDLRRRIEIAERAGNKEGAQQLIQDLEAVAPGTVARQEKQNAQLRTLTKMGIGGAVAGPAALLTSTIAAPANEAIMSREIDTDLPPSDSLAQYWKYGAQMFRGEAQIGSKQPQSIEDWMKIQEQDAKLTAAESKLVPGEGFFRKGIQALASSAPGMIDTLVQSGGFAPSSYKQWADQGTGAILREALRGRDVRSMSKEELDEFYYMAKGAGALYAGVEFAQSPLALTKALGFDVGGQFVKRTLEKVASVPGFKNKLVQMGMRFAGRTVAEAGEEGPQQIITDLAVDSIKTMADNPDTAAAEAVGKNVAENWRGYGAKGLEAAKQAIIPAAGMILGGKVVETPFRLAAAQKAKKEATKDATSGPQPGPEDAEPFRDIEKFKQEWREAELPEEVITKLADNYAKGDKAGEDAIIAEYEASQAAAAREAAKTPATATEEAPTPTQGPAPEGGKAAQAGPVAANVDNTLQAAQKQMDSDRADTEALLREALPDTPIKITTNPHREGVAVSPDGKTIEASHDLARKLKERFPGREREALGKIVDEERIHQEQIGKLGDGFKAKLASVWKNASRQVRHAVNTIYGPSRQTATADEMGAELLRMAAQSRRGSGLTESMHPTRGKAATDNVGIINQWADEQSGEIAAAIGQPRESTDATGPAIQVDRADGEAAPDTSAGTVRRDGESDAAGVEAARPPAPEKGTGIRASPDVQPQEKVKEKASEVVPEKPEVPQREREPESQLQEGRQAADEAPEPRQPDVLTAIDRAEQLKDKIGRLRATAQSRGGTSRTAQLGLLGDAERELASITIDQKAAKQNAERSVSVGDIVWTAMNESVQANGRDQDRARNTPFIVVKVNPKTLRVKSQQTGQEFTVYRSATIPYALSRQAQPAATPTSTADGVAGPISIEDVHDMAARRADIAFDDAASRLKVISEFAEREDPARRKDAQDFVDRANALYNDVKSKLKNVTVNERDLKERILSSPAAWGYNDKGDKIEMADAYPLPVYVAAGSDPNTVGLDLHQDGHFEMFEGNDEATPATLDLVNNLLGVGDKKVRVWTSQPSEIVMRIKSGDIPEGIFVSPRKEHAAGYYGEGREMTSFMIPLRQVAQHSDVDWQTRKPLPESAAKPQDTGREPTITASGDATREIYPQEFEDRIKAGLNPSQEAERVPGSPAVAEKSLHEAQAAKITGNKVKAIAQDGSVYRGLLYSLAQHSPATADMFYGAGTVTYYLHRAGILKPGHTISEFEPLRAVMARQLAGPNFQRVADETKRLVKQINGMLVAAEKIATNATTGDEIVAAFAKHLAAMPDPSEQTYAIRKQHEQDIIASFIDSINSFPDRYQEKNGKPPGAKEIEQAWRLSTRLYMLRFWSDLKFPEYLAEGQDLREMRKKLRKREELLAKYPELEGMDEDTPKDDTQEWLFGQLQKTEMTEPPRLKDTPETAAFNMAVQWIVGGNDAIATQPGEIGGLKTLFTMLKGGADWSDAEIDTVVRKNHEALKDSTVLQADSWPEIVRLAGEKPGVLIVADPSYFAEDETKGTKNYGVFTEIKKGDQLLAKVDQYLIPAWKKGARIILTNTYEPDIVKRLQDRGFNVVTFERDGGTREFAAYNANPETGEILPPRPASRWSETERKARGRQFEFRPRSEPDATGGTAGVQASKKRVEQGAAGETAGRGGVAYPIAGDEVDGRTVRDEIPNLSSISASLDQYEILSGVREVPMSEFDLSGEHYSVEGNKRISELANAISESGEITPLIVVVDKDGPYILEGATRADALFRLKAKSFPALVVIDKSDIQFSKRRKTPRTTEKVKARAALIEGPVDFALSDYPIPYLPRRAKDRTGGTRDPVNTVMSTLRYYAREGTMEQKRIARELLDRWTTESSRSPDEWYEEMSGSNPAVAGTDLGDFMANIVGPEVERIMEGRTLTPSDQFMDKEAEGEAEEAYRAAVEGMEAGSATPDVFKQAPALAEIGTTSEKPYRIVYPEGTVEAYKDADGWHVRTNRLLPFRRVDGTKAGRAMAASLDARLAAAKGETDGDRTRTSRQPETDVSGDDDARDFKRESQGQKVSTLKEVLADAVSRGILRDVTPQDVSRIGYHPEILTDPKWRDAAELAERLGIDLVPTSNSPYNGVKINEVPDAVFVDVENQYPIITTTGHEAHHILNRDYDTGTNDPKTNPALALRMALDEQISAESLQRFLSGKLGRRYRHLSEAKAREEMHADFMGEMLTKKSFWDRLYRISQKAFDVLANIVNRILGHASVEAHLSITDYFADIAKAQDAAAAFYKHVIESKAERTAAPSDDLPFSTKRGIVTPEQDARYLELAKDPEGNKAELQKMVDEAARKAGYKDRVKHGTDEARNTFDGGAYFTDSAGDASAYAELRALRKAVEENDDLSEIVSDILAEEGGEDITDLGPQQIRDIADANNIDIEAADGVVMDGYIRAGNALDLRSQGTDIGNLASTWDDLHQFGLVNEQWSELDEDTQAELKDQYKDMALYVLLEREGILAKAFEKGYDTVIFEDKSPVGNFSHTSWLTGDASQFKSADPITRDDQGNVIPLSQRFNPGSPDIRVSARREPNLFLQAKALEAQPPEGMKQRLANLHMIENPDLTKEFRDQIAPMYYEQMPHEKTIEEGMDIIKAAKTAGDAEAQVFNLKNGVNNRARVAAAIALFNKYRLVAADKNSPTDIREDANRRANEMGQWLAQNGTELGQAVDMYKVLARQLDTLPGATYTAQWALQKAHEPDIQEVAPLAEAIAEVAEIERVQVEKQAQAIPEDMVAKAIYDEVVKRYRALDEVNQRLRMRSAAKILKAIGDVIADPVRRNAPSLAEANKKIDEREAKAMERLKAKLAGIQASEKRDLPGDDIIPEPDRSDLIDLTVGQIRKNGMADVVAFTKWIKDTFGTAYEGKEISSVWYDAVQQYGETIAPYLTGPAKAKHAKAKESIKKDRELQMDLPAQPSPFLGFSSEELAKYRKTELQGIIDQTRLRATGTTQPTPEEAAQMELQARQDAPQGDIFPKELFLKAKAQDVIDLTKLSANAKAVFLAATTPDTTMAELYAQAGVPTEGVPYTNIIDTKLADLLTGPVLEKAIREHLRTWNESLARLAMQDASAGETLAGSLAKQLTATFGLTPYKASILEQAIRKKVVRMTEAARQKELKLVLKEKKIAEPRRGHRKAINEVLALANLGALDAQNINQVIAKKLGISTELTTEQVSELDRLSKAIRAANEGTPKNDATRDAMRYIARQTGRNWWRVWTAQFYNNIFSAPPTTARNVAGTSINDLQETLVDLSMNPDAVIAMMKGKAKGVIPGFHELLAKLRGKTVQRAADKLEMPNDIEVNWPRAGLFFNFPTNFLTGQDLPFYTSAEHAALATLAFEEARKTPDIGVAEATRRAMHRIYGSKEDQQAWVDQAEAEYPGNSVSAKLDRKRRIHELMLMRLPQEWQTAMKEAGGRHSLNDMLDPDSTITAAAKILTQFASRAMPVKFTVAIITMPARLLQRNLDYMGYGLVRAKFGHTQNWNWFTLGHRKPNLETPEQRDIHRRRAIFGIGFSLATNLLAALAAGVFEDDEEEKKKMQKRPWFSLNGPGPKSGEQRSQLRRTGWFPWSIGIQLPGSDKIRYFPMALMGTMTLNLMMSGFVWDAIRHKSLKDTSVTGWVTAIGLMGIRGMLDMSPTRNAVRMLDAVTSENTETAINQMTRQLAGTFDAMIVPASAGVNWIAKMIDPVNYESGSFVVEVLKKTPAAKYVGKPAIDDLGYTVKGMYPVLWSTEKTDAPGKVWKLIVDNEAWIPRVGRPMITDQEFPAGRPITDEERYLMIKIRGQLLAREIEQNMSTYESKTQAEFQEAVDEKLSEYYDQAKAAIQQAAQDPSYDPESVLK